MTIKAIQTRYKGYHFRSRLEARWAVFFDAIGLDWEYEPEGFDLDGMWYLPDFLLTLKNGQKQYIEVKPKGLGEDEKFNAFEQRINSDGEHTARMVSGDPMFCFSSLEKDSPMMMICHGCGGVVDQDRWDVFPGASHGYMQWCCDSCDRRPMRRNFIKSSAYFHKGIMVIDHRDDAIMGDGGVVKNAAQKARSARFEHGETPNV